jgi:hypothetical protein
MPSSQAERVLHERMIAFGFCREEAALYGQVLRQGSTSFKQLFLATRIDPDRIRMALRKLALLCLLSELRNTDRTRFVATPPAHAWDALMFDNLWRSATIATSTIDQIPAPGKAADIAELRAAAMACVRDAGKSPLWYLKSFDDTDQFALACSGALHDARARVVSAERPPRLAQTALFWPAILACRARGIHYTRYATLDEVFVHGVEIVTRDTKEMHIDLRIAPAAAFLGSSFYMIDDTTLFLFGSDPTTKSFSARQTRNPEVIDRQVLKKVKPLADSAVPFNDLIGNISDHVDELRRGVLEVSHRTVFDLVARLGRFAVLPDEQRAAAKVLVARGLLQQVPGGYALAISSYPLLAELM